MRERRRRSAGEDLYARWEHGNWSATDLDFTEDARQWREVLTPFEREAALWNYALFFWGEDAVAENLSPFIDAAPREEQKYFLATQQVDEARHAVFFGRFMREVAGLGSGARDGPGEAARGGRDGGGQAELLEAIRPRLTWGFRKVFDRLDTMADELRRDRSLLREVLPWTAAVLVPPGWDRRYTEVFGFTLEEIGAEGATSLDAKLRSAGLGMGDLPGPPPLPPELEPHEHAERGFALMQAGILGEKTGPPSRDDATLELLFDVVRRSVDPDHGFERPVTLQWEFSDAPAWSVRIDNGSTAARPGLDPAADVTLRCRYEDWVDVVAGRRDPRRLLLTGRLRPRGSLGVLRRMPRLFGA